MTEDQKDLLEEARVFWGRWLLACITYSAYDSSIRAKARLMLDLNTEGSQHLTKYIGDPFPLLNVEV